MNKLILSHVGFGLFGAGSTMFLQVINPKNVDGLIICGALTIVLGILLLIIFNLKQKVK